jgi:hypothetical protein
MSSQISILLFGLDEHLLGTRSLLLRKAGYRVFVATGLAQINSLSQVETIDLMILCHTLDLKESGRALAFAQSQWPFMKSLILSAVGSWSEAGNPDLVFEASQGPAKLLATLGHLLPQASSSHSHLY